MTNDKSPIAKELALIEGRRLTALEDHILGTLEQVTAITSCSMTKLLVVKAIEPTRLATAAARDEVSATGVDDHPTEVDASSHRVPDAPADWNKPGPWVLFSPDDDTYLQAGIAADPEWAPYSTGNAWVFETYGDALVEAWNWQGCHAQMVTV